MSEPFRPRRIAHHLAQEALDIGLALGADHQAEPVPSPDQGERRFGGAEDFDAAHRRRGAAQRSGMVLRLGAGLAETMTPASRPNGGRPARSRSAISRA